MKNFQKNVNFKKMMKVFKKNQRKIFFEKNFRIFFWGKKMKNFQKNEKFSKNENFSKKMFKKM